MSYTVKNENKNHLVIVESDTGQVVYKTTKKREIRAICRKISDKETKLGNVRMLLSFKEYITEATEDRGLTVFDIDETLFKTNSLIYVMKDGEIVKKLSNQEYNNYKLRDGEEFDYREFRNAETFDKTSIPIWTMIDKAKAIIKNAVKKGSKVIMITARADFDDKEKFLSTFRRHGIDIDNVYIERAGNLNLGSTAKNKKYLFHKYLRGGKYNRVRFFDDSMNNIRSFKSLEKEYPDIKFYPYFVTHEGKVKRV